jgi:hypothetical protein
MIRQPWLRILLFERWPGRWIARALEHDIEVEERSIDGALQALLAIIHAHIKFDQRHGRAPLSGFSSAPARYWQAFMSATPLRTGSVLASDITDGHRVGIAVAIGRVGANLAFNAPPGSMPALAPASSTGRLFDPGEPHRSKFERQRQ